MSRFDSARLTRRTALQGGLAMVTWPLTGLVAVPAMAQTRPVTKVLDFTTSADVAKAEQEGEVLFYTHDSEPAAAGIVEAFTKDFPKIKGKYVRAQNGALFTQDPGRALGRRFDVDVIQFSEPATALDFQKRGGYDALCVAAVRGLRARASEQPGRRLLLGRRRPSPASSTTPTRSSRRTHRRTGRTC